MANPTLIDSYLADFRAWLIDANFKDQQNNLSEEWLGKVFVDRLDSTSGETRTIGHFVSIFLPKGFPYQAPKVYCRDNEPLSPSWHLSPDQCLCLWQEPNGWEPFTAAQSLLERIREWFGFYHSGSWPKNSIVPDLHLYFENEGLVILGENWNITSDVQHGDFALWRDDKNSQFFPSFVVPREQPGSNEIKPKPEKRLIDNLLWNESFKFYLGFWFRLHQPFIPPRNLAELCSLIDRESGWVEGQCVELFAARLGRDSNVLGFSIALGYPDYFRSERWLFLWVQKPKGHKLRFSNQANLADVKIKSFRTASARKTDLIRRIAHISPGLEQKRVCIFGIGALGGNVAVLLSKTGLGQIDLIDSDILLPTNTIRHIAGLRSVGLPKTYCVQNIIKSHNPDCKTELYDETWDIEQIKKIIRGSDLVIDTTANVPFSLYLNQICVSLNQPVLFSTSYRRACIGRIVIRRANPEYQDPCLYCYLQNRGRWSESEFPTIPQDPTSSFIEDGCGSPTEEADAVHLNFVATLTAKLVPQILKDEKINGNLLVQVNEILPDSPRIFSSLGIHPFNNKCLQNCGICQPRN